MDITIYVSRTLNMPFGKTDACERKTSETFSIWIMQLFCSPKNILFGFCCWCRRWRWRRGYITATSSAIAMAVVIVCAPRRCLLRPIHYCMMLCSLFNCYGISIAFSALCALRVPVCAWPGLQQELKWENKYIQNNTHTQYQKQFCYFM